MTPPSLAVVSEVAERLSYALLCEELRVSFLSQVMRAQNQESSGQYRRKGVSTDDSDSDSDEGEEVGSSYGGEEVAALLADVYSSLISKHSLGLTVCVNTMHHTHGISPHYMLSYTHCATNSLL